MFWQQRFLEAAAPSLLKLRRQVSKRFPDGFKVNSRLGNDFPHQINKVMTQRLKIGVGRVQGLAKMAAGID